MPPPGLPSRRISNEVIVEEEEEDALEGAFTLLDEQASPANSKRKDSGEPASGNIFKRIFRGDDKGKPPPEPEPEPEEEEEEMGFDLFD